MRGLHRLVMTTAASPIEARPAPSPWFRSASFDLLLLLCVPFLTWPLVMAGTNAWGADLLNQLILLTATGHYFATFVRAYGDRDLFERFRIRFLLTPVVLLVTCVGMFVSGNGPVLMIVTATWAFWHWLAQAFGFARIYDIKVGSYRRLTTWLDKGLVISGFVGAVVLNDGATAEFAQTFLAAGIPLPNAEQFVVVEQFVLGAMIVIGVAYLANLGRAIARGEPWSWQKQFMHVTTIGYYWFAFAWLPNVIVAYVLYELFHDIQYFAITWLTCRQRVRRPGVTSWLGHMFRPGWTATIMFMVVMLAFGGADVLGRGTLTPDETGHRVWLGIIITFALLHYYYDGFIWKARERTLGDDLGIQGGLRATVVPGMRHAASWGWFFVPMVAIGLAGNRELSQRERLEALVALAPGDFLNQAELGLELVRARDYPGALAHYAESIALNPDLAQTRSNYGAALDLAGELDAARVQYELALTLGDHGGAHAQAHINLGVLLLTQGERAAADRHLEAGRRLGGDNPIGRMLGLVAAIPWELEANAPRRLSLLTAILALDPKQLESRYQLGNMMLEQRRFHQAAEHFSFLVEQAPDVALGMVGLATAQTELGQVDQARAMLQRALALVPNDPKALALKARLGL